MMTADQVSAIANSVTAIAAGVAACAAWRGVEAWRNELRGRAEYELARRILTTVYSLRDAVVGVRARMMLVEEYADRPRRLNASSQADLQDLAYAYRRRAAPVRTTQSALLVELREAEALWGNSLPPAYAALNRCLVDLSVNISLFIEHGPHVHETRQLEREELQRIDRIIHDFSTPDTPDEFSRQLANAVEMFERELVPRLRQPS